MSTRKFAVGDRVWEYEGGTRAYQPLWIVGTARGAYRVARDPDGSPWRVSYEKAEKDYLTDAERDAAIYVSENRHSIVDQVRLCRDAATLRRVAELVGYREGE